MKKPGKKKNSQEKATMNGKGIPVIYIIGFIVLLAGFARWNSERAVENLKESKCYAIGTIKNYFSTKGQKGYNYEFYVKGEKYESHFNYSHDIGVFSGKKFTVLYHCDNPSENTILIFPSTFSLLNEAFPDSLFWVRKYAEY